MPKLVYVEKAFAKYLTEAVQFVKRNEADIVKGSASGIAGGVAGAVAKRLMDQNIPHNISDDKNKIPANHVYHGE